ncbi:MAG TPA: hypothetical protein VNC22_23195 [Sporichthya sp.]|jgi:hypothetical protein|nr:hypothetical protein [Sporichthya sp.]
MAGCGCGSSAGCSCVLAAAADGDCDAVEIEVTGAGSSAVPFVIGAVFHPTRFIREDGNEPWKIETVSGCDTLLPRCQYEAEPFLPMVNSSHTLVGFAFLGLDCETGTNVPLYEAVDSTSTSTALPSGWEPACTSASAGHFIPMFTDPDDEATRVGYAFVRYDIESGTYQQRYITNAGSVTTTKPGSWKVGSCGTASSSGGTLPSGGVSTVPGSAHFYLMSSTIKDGYYYPDWGIPSLQATPTQCVDTLSLPTGYDDASWKRIIVTLHGLSGALTEDFTVTVKDVTGTVDVATLTIASGTAPTSGKIYSDATIVSGSWDDNTDIQAFIECEDDLVGGCHIEVQYELNPS